MFRFEGLEIWTLAIDYAKSSYIIARKFPDYEKFSLADQLRRASISISNNIAEGSVGSAANFRKYLITSIGSTLEVVNIIHFSRVMEYITQEEKEKMYCGAEELIKKLHSFSNSLS